MAFEIDPRELNLQDAAGMQLVELLRKTIAEVEEIGAEVEEIGTGIFWAERNTTTYSELTAAYNSGKPIFMKDLGLIYCMSRKGTDYFLFTSIIEGMVDTDEIAIAYIPCDDTDGWGNQEIRSVATATDEQVAEAVDAWLDDNVTQETGYVLDSSLTLSNAAAPANKVGELRNGVVYGEVAVEYALEDGGINGSGTPFGETSGTYMRFADYHETSSGVNIVFNDKGGNVGDYSLFAVYYDSSKSFEVREETGVGYTIKTNYAYFKLSYYSRNGNNEEMYRSWITWNTYGTVKDAVDKLYHPVTFTKNSNVLTIENEKAVFTFQKITDQTKNVDTWRLYKGDLKTDSGLFNMWTGSDAEGAIKLVGESDFIGGFHGNEIANSISVYVDGQLVNMSNNITPTKCETVEIFVNSNVYHYDGETQAFARNKRLLFDKNGVTIGNCFVATGALSVQQASLALFQCYRADSDNNEVLHGYSVNSDYAFYDIDDTTHYPANSVYMTSGEYITSYGTVKCEITQIDQKYAQYYFSDVSIGTLTAQDRMKIYFNTIKNTPEGVSVAANDSIIGEFRLTVE